MCRRLEGNIDRYADLTNLINPFILGAPAPCCCPVGGWVEVGRTTLTSGCDATITVSSLPNKRYYMVLGAVFDVAAASGFRMRLGGACIDTGCNYADRNSFNNGAEFTCTCNCFLKCGFGGLCDNFLPTLTVDWISNLPCEEKLVVGNGQHAGGAGECTAPGRTESVGKWVNTCCSIGSVELFNNTSTYVTGEVVVLGWDPGDTHTTNFWEELGTTQLGTPSDDLDVTCFTAKKYLWIQSLLVACGGNMAPLITFNNDSCTNYSMRYQCCGCTENTSVNRANIFPRGTDNATNHWFNMFVINEANENKIVGGFTTIANTDGACNPPLRAEWAGKWDATAQITRMDINAAGAGQLGQNSYLKIWGSN